MFVITRLSLVLSLTLLLTSQAVSQPPKGQFPPFNREREAIEDKDIPKSSEINAVARLAQSPEPDYVVQSDADKALVDKVMKYFIFRLTWEEVQRDRDPERVGTISSIMNELIGSNETNPRLLPRPFTGPGTDQDVISTRQRQIGNVQQFTPIMIKYCKLVLQNNQLIARINAARVLAKLAEWGQEAVVDELTQIINHPGEHDAVRLWAFHGLEDIYTLMGTSDMRAKGLFQSKEGTARLNASLTAVYTWLNNNTKVPESRLQFMKPDEQDGLRYVRRAAAQALGASRRPLIVDERSAGKQEGPIADILCRIVGGDASITPAPNLRERLDASVALCQLRGDFSPSFQIDYATYQIGLCLTVLGAQANADRDSTGAPAAAWKLESARLRTALNGFTAQKSSGPTVPYLNNFKQKALALLEYFDDFSKNPGSVKELNDWLRDNPPANKQVYKPIGER